MSSVKNANTVNFPDDFSVIKSPYEHWKREKEWFKDETVIAGAEYLYWGYISCCPWPNLRRMDLLHLSEDFHKLAETEQWINSDEDGKLSLIQRWLKFHLRAS